MARTGPDAGPFKLGNGARIAVVGGGPAGSFFGIFALKMAKMLGREITVTIFEPKDFRKIGPAGCNRCGGVISEFLVQALAVEGINLTDAVVRKGINSYDLHTNQGDVHIDAPNLQKTIATVFRGFGPRGMATEGVESFDNFLLGQAIREGSLHSSLRIDRIELRNKKPVLFSREGEVGEFDLVVGAVGLDRASVKMFEDIGFGYSAPSTVTAAISELSMGEEVVSGTFGNSIHLFLLPDRGIKFAAMIPKGSCVTLVLMGREMDAGTVSGFLDNPVVKGIVATLPRSEGCRCLPRMNVGAAGKPFTDRVVLCGDAGSTRLFKDGLGAAYLTGKAAANTAVLRGVAAADFRDGYYPVYKRINNDNLFGEYLFAVIDFYRKSATLTRGMLEVVRKEQQEPGDRRVLSSILWDMFTGNEPYRNVVSKAFDPLMHVRLYREIAGILLGRRS